MLKNYNKELDLYKIFNIIDRVCFNNFLSSTGIHEIIEYDKEVPQTAKGLVKFGTAFVEVRIRGSHINYQNEMSIYIYKNSNEKNKIAALLHEMIHCYINLKLKKIGRGKFMTHGKLFFKLQNKYYKQLKLAIPNIAPLFKHNDKKRAIKSIQNLIDETYKTLIQIEKKKNSPKYRYVKSFYTNKLNGYKKEILQIKRIPENELY